MKTQNDIVHEGVINVVRNGVALVSIERSSGCAGCHAKNSCGVSNESETNILEVPVYDQVYSPGEKVHVHISRTNAIEAVFLGYFLPFIILVTVLLILIMSGISEPVAGLVSIGILIPYYVFLRLFNAWFKKHISFYMSRL